MTLRPHIATRRTRLFPPGTGAKLFLLLSLLTYAPAAALAQKVAALHAGDGPVTVEGGSVFKAGKLTFEQIDPSKVAPMPKGWAAYNNAAYKISFGEGVMVGPHVIRFGVASATDRKLFDSLFVLRAEWDKVDEKYFWEDRTIHAPDTPAPDFGAKTISARADDLGVFVIARLVEPQPLNSATADLSVEIVAPPGKALGNRELAYEIKITNRGPQDAAGLILHGAGFSSDQFVSATPPARGGGRCKQDGSNYDCKLDLLEQGATAVFRLVLLPRENPHVPYPDEGQRFNVNAFVASPADDPNPDNNQAHNDLLVFPDPNGAPRVRLTAPAREELFVTPADIKLTAKASDPEGALTKVEFYAGKKLIGAGERTGKDQYSIIWRAAPPGRHQLSVFVTDDGGRQVYDTRSVTVNGGLSVRIASPLPGAAYNRTSEYRGEMQIVHGPLSLEAAAFVRGNGRGVKKVVFSIYPESPVMGQRKEIVKHAGADEASGEAHYVAAFTDLNPADYVLSVVATDGEGVETVSQPVRFRVNAAPLVKLRPLGTDAASLKAPADVPLVAEVFTGWDFSARDPKGGKVDFYADGKLIGSAALDGYVNIGSFNWRGVPAGSYSVTAVVTDGRGLVSVPSAPLRVTVRNE